MTAPFPRAFLDDEAEEVRTEANVARLAQAIQTAIEDTLVAIYASTNAEEG